MQKFRTDPFYAPSTMKETLKWPLVTLLSGGFLHLVARQTSPQGTTELETKTLLESVAWLVSVFLGLGAWTYQLWKRDRKRERVKDATSLGRRICPCSETGEIMVRVDGYIEHDTLRCPCCDNVFVDHTIQQGNRP